MEWMTPDSLRQLIGISCFFKASHSFNSGSATSWPVTSSHIQISVKDNHDDDLLKPPPTSSYGLEAFGIVDFNKIVYVFVERDTFS